MASTGQQSLASMDQTMPQLAESTGSISSKLSVISERAANINSGRDHDHQGGRSDQPAVDQRGHRSRESRRVRLGFLVVAREIRRLADMTAVATLDIERMVKEMQYSVSAGVMEMDKFSEQVRKVVGEVGQIGGQLGQIIRVPRACTPVRPGDRRDARLVAGGRADPRSDARLSEAANQTSIALREFNKATESLREAVGGLKEEVSRFTLGPIEPAPSRFCPRQLLHNDHWSTNHPCCSRP